MCERGGEITPGEFRAVARRRIGAARSQRAARRSCHAETAANIASRRAIYEVRAAHSPETQLWHSQDSTAWTVVYEADARFPVSCLNRFIYVKPVRDLTEALQNADAVRGQVSTVGLAAPDIARGASWPRSWRAGA